MVRDVSSSYSTLFEAGILQVCEIYKVELRDGTIYYFAAHDQDITWNGQTYTAFPISRDPIRFNINLEIDTCRVYVANVSGALSEYVQANNLDHAEVTIKRIHYTKSYSSDDELTIFIGHADVEFNRDILILELRPWIDSLNLQTPGTTYQEGCNWSLFDDYCTLEQSSFSYRGYATTDGSRTVLTDTNRGLLYKAQFTGGNLTTTVLKGDIVTGGTGGGTAKVVNIVYDDSSTGRLWYCELSGTNFVDGETLLASNGGTLDIDGTPAEDVTFYENGELYIRTGDNAGQRRPILHDQSYDITAIWPLPNAVQSYDSYTIYPNCDGRANETCHSWFGNDENFYGFLYVPRIEEVLL